MLPDAQQTDSFVDTFSQLINQGTTAHAAGDPVKALTAFESALALNPQDSHAVSACAALLFELSRPRAAFALLQSIESRLLLGADGCANLGLAALNCEQTQLATAYFEQALKLSPTHASALTYLGLLAARDQRWLDAVGYARRCVTCTPDDETAHTNLIDYLLGARCATEALQQLHVLPELVKSHPKIAIRRVVALALNAEFEAAKQATAHLNPRALTELANLLRRGGAADLQNLFYRQAVDAMQECDWRDYPRLCAMLGENKLHNSFQLSAISGAIDPSKTLPPFTLNRRTTKPADRIHVGIAVTSLHDAAATQALAAELSLYDSSQFTFHIYSPTPQPQAVLSAPLAAHQVVEIAHFTDDEAVWRIRLDRLDIWLDLTCNTPWHRQNIAIHRVASLQMLPLPAARRLAANIYDYAFSDAHLQATRLQDASTSDQNPVALARLPLTCWFAAPAAAVTKLSRQTAGLPADAFVVCGFGPSAHITPKNFALWIRLIKRLPNAVLWLSPCSPQTQSNLRREAVQADVPAERLVFATTDASTQALLPSADLFLDSPGNCNPQTLVQALRAGVPSLAAVSSSATSILNAAGLGDCIFDNTDAYQSRALHLAKNPSELKALRERMRSSVAQSPLFDEANRASERAMAWMMMVKRSRAGLMPATFDVPLAGTSG